MSSTLNELRVSPPFSTPDRPDPGDVDRARHGVAPDELEELPIGPDATNIPEGVEFAQAAGKPLKPAQRGPLVVDVGSDGIFIVRDLTGAVYGAAPTLDEARAEFDVALDDHLLFLRENLESLNPRLAAELRVLERLFPGR